MLPAMLLLPLTPRCHQGQAGCCHQATAKAKLAIKAKLAAAATLPLPLPCCQHCRDAAHHHRAAAAKLPPPLTLPFEEEQKRCYKVPTRL
jgi:hypothetical protein